MASITLSGVSKVFEDGFCAVDALDLEIEDRELVVLVGPSGCGKSTTLRMIAGLEPVTSGTIAIDERVVNEVPAKDRDVAMVFQNYALYPHLSVRKNLSFGLERRREYTSFLQRVVSSAYRREARAESSSIKSRVEHAAAMLGITPLFDRRPAELSGGQRQRVAVGRALVRDPSAFLFDEPLSNLDAKLRLEMRTELKALHKKTRATMVYVTHDQEEAMTLGDRIVVMNEGLVQQCATPADVYGRPANRFVAEFVGTPTMNFLETSVHFTEGRLFIMVAGDKVPLPGAVGGTLSPFLGRGVVMGLRPETLHPGAHGVAARVELIEDLGDRQDVVYRLDSGARIVGRIPSDTRLREDLRVHLPLDLERAHFFEDTDEGMRIG
ncbi:MAG: ATP-binding cassette domain-containing protein [bacterium]|nr:ATP-binding cassette domain-containing protein [bacterium]